MNRTKQEVVSEFRCGEILEAARKLFARKGFHQTTMENIAGAAGVAKGTLYLYFRSKRAIYLAALRRGLLALQEETNSQFETAETVAEKIRAFIATRIRYFEKNHDFFKIYFSEFGNLLAPTAAPPKDFRDLYWQQAQILESVIREAVQQGTLRQVRPDSTALAIYDMTRGLIVQRLLWGTKTAVEADIEFLFDLVWRGIENRKKI
ncbi:MAG: TetR/AcrR family transcriptional regulator [Acidobacteria bacterium]|nr:TetR/AcrR family transcriptional regulator [Acidobacteriota bacterium]